MKNKVNVATLFQMIKNKQLKNKCEIKWFPKNRVPGNAIELYFDEDSYDCCCIKYKADDTNWISKGYWSFEDTFEIISDDEFKAIPKWSKDMLEVFKNNKKFKIKDLQYYISLVMSNQNDLISNQNKLIEKVKRLENVRNIQ